MNCLDQRGLLPALNYEHCDSLFIEAFGYNKLHQPQLQITFQMLSLLATMKCGGSVTQLPLCNPANVVVSGHNKIWQQWNYFYIQIRINRNHKLPAVWDAMVHLIGSI